MREIERFVSAAARAFNEAAENENWGRRCTFLGVATDAMGSVCIVGETEGTIRRLEWTGAGEAWRWASERVECEACGGLFFPEQMAYNEATDTSRVCEGCENRQWREARERGESRGRLREEECGE